MSSGESGAALSQIGLRLPYRLHVGGDPVLAEEAPEGEVGGEDGGLRDGGLLELLLGGGDGRSVAVDEDVRADRAAEDRLHLPVGPRETVLSEIDRALCSANSEYDEKRRTERLLPVALETLPAGTWQRFTRARQSRLGGSIEQYKHPCLVGDLQFLARLRRDHLADQSAA